VSRPENIVLFGEGKTEAVFLRHLTQLYRDELGKTKVKIDAGQGGSPKQVANRLIRKVLNIGSYDRSLLLLDCDIPHDIPKKWLKENSIGVVASAPMCLEGLFLTMLDDLPPRSERAQSKHWKRRFHQNHLKTDRDSDIVAKLSDKCPTLFPRELIDIERAKHPCLSKILSFLNV